MLNLLKIEWLKVKNYRTFWILAGLFIISIFGINYITFYFQTHLTSGVGANPKGNEMVNAIIGSPPFEFPNVWQTVTYMSGFLLFIEGLLMIISITNEFSFKTHRQNVIDGLSRTQFITVKMWLAVIIALASTIVVFIIAFLFGLSQNASGISFANIEYIGYFFIQALSYAAVALVFGLLFKRSGIAIGVFFLYVMVLEHMLSAISSHFIDNIGYYYPLAASSALIPFPFLHGAIKIKQLEPPATINLLIASVAYLAIFYFICKRKFETDDL